MEADEAILTCFAINTTSLVKKPDTFWGQLNTHLVVLSTLFNTLKYTVWHPSGFSGDSFVCAWSAQAHGGQQVTAILLDRQSYCNRLIFRVCCIYAYCLPLWIQVAQLPRRKHTKDLVRTCRLSFAKGSLLGFRTTRKVRLKSAGLLKTSTSCDFVSVGRDFGLGFSSIVLSSFSFRIPGSCERKLTCLLLC